MGAAKRARLWECQMSGRGAPSGAPVPGDEIGQKRKSCALTLFRMELGSEDISPRNRASKRRWIAGCRGGQRGILGHRVITVGERETGALLENRPERVCARLVHGAPAHVGNLQ